MLKVENLNKSYGLQQLFTDVNFVINSHEKLALVGRNGHGKTTLFRLLMKLEKNEGGSIEVRDGYRIGYVEQADINTNKTILEYIMSFVPEEWQHDFWRAEIILSGLGFNREIFEDKVDTLSGGWQVRLKLASAMISEPDLLLLDEPTNYLDITTIRWLKNYLQQWPRECLVISHDASFLDGFIDGVLGIYRHQVYKVMGKTKDYYKSIAQRDEMHEKERIKQINIRKQNEHFIRSFRAKARWAGMVQSRIKMLAKQESLQALEKVPDIKFSFPYQNTYARALLEVEDLAFGYEKLNLFENISFKLQKGECLAIVGPNGAGKSTMMKVLVDRLQPREGKIHFPKTAIADYYAQGATQELDLNKNVLETLFDYGLNNEQGRQLAAQLLFTERDLDKKVRVLSGGEKNRLRLGKLLASNNNILFLDEPTNHFDLESSQALLKALKDFAGCIVIITHNELFLRQLADRLLVFGPNDVKLHECSYDFFLEHYGWPEEIVKQTSKDKDKQKARQEFKEQRQEKQYLQKQVNKIEDKIIKLEAKDKELLVKLEKASNSQNWKKVEKLGREYKNIEKDLEKSNQEWDLLTDKLNNI